MDLKLTLAAGLFAVAAALSVGASASPAIPADAKAEDSAPQKQMKHHSHMEEKTGVAQKARVPQEKAPEALPKKLSAAKDQSKHFHPRDGK